jgi:hypothetical protein
MITGLVNHLWQSTLVAGLAWLVTLALRRDRAGIRYAVWLAASFKFLIPFSALTSLGARFGWHPVVVAAFAHDLAVDAGGVLRCRRSHRHTNQPVCRQPIDVERARRAARRVGDGAVALLAMWIALALPLWVARQSTPLTEGPIVDMLRVIDGAADASDCGQQFRELARTWCVHPHATLGSLG